jgi:hypothetical protein
VSARSDLVSSLVTFHVRLWIGSIVLAVLVPVSFGAAVLNFLGGQGPESGPYGTVHRSAERLNGWLKQIGETPPRRSGYRADDDADEVDVRARASARRAGVSA